MASTPQVTKEMNVRLGVEDYRLRFDALDAEAAAAGDAEVHDVAERRAAALAEAEASRAGLQAQVDALLGTTPARAPPKQTVTAQVDLGDDDSDDSSVFADKLLQDYGGDAGAAVSDDDADSGVDAASVTVADSASVRSGGSPMFPAEGSPVAFDGLEQGEAAASAGAPTSPQQAHTLAQKREALQQHLLQRQAQMHEWEQRRIAELQQQLSAHQSDLDKQTWRLQQHVVSPTSAGSPSASLGGAAGEQAASVPAEDLEPSQAPQALENLEHFVSDDADQTFYTSPDNYYNNVKSGSTPAMVVLPRVGPSHRHGFFKSVALRGAGTQQEDPTQQANEDEVEAEEERYRQHVLRSRRMNMDEARARQHVLMLKQQRDSRRHLRHRTPAQLLPWQRQPSRRQSHQPHHTGPSTSPPASSLGLYPPASDSGSPPPPPVGRSPPPGRRTWSVGGPDDARLPGKPRRKARHPRLPRASNSTSRALGSSTSLPLLGRHSLTGSVTTSVASGSDREAFLHLAAEKAHAQLADKRRRLRALHSSVVNKMINTKLGESLLLNTGSHEPSAELHRIGAGSSVTQSAPASLLSLASSAASVATGSELHSPPRRQPRRSLRGSRLSISTRSRRTSADSLASHAMPAAATSPIASREPAAIRGDPQRQRGGDVVGEAPTSSGVVPLKPRPKPSPSRGTLRTKPQRSVSQVSVTLQVAAGGGTAGVGRGAGRSAGTRGMMPRRRPLHKSKRARRAAAQATAGFENSGWATEVGQGAGGSGGGVMISRDDSHSHGGHSSRETGFAVEAHRAFSHVRGSGKGSNGQSPQSHSRTSPQQQQQQHQQAEKTDEVEEEVEGEQEKRGGASHRSPSISPVRPSRRARQSGGSLEPRRISSASCMPRSPQARPRRRSGGGPQAAGSEGARSPSQKSTTSSITAASNRSKPLQQQQPHARQRRRQAGGAATAGGGGGGGAAQQHSALHMKVAALAAPPVLHAPRRNPVLARLELIQQQQQQQQQQLYQQHYYDDFDVELQRQQRHSPTQDDGSLSAAMSVTRALSPSPPPQAIHHGGRGGGEGAGAGEGVDLDPMRSVPPPPPVHM